MQRAGQRASTAAKRKAKAAEPEGVPPAPKTLADAVRWSSWAMHAVATGRLDARSGHEIGYLVNAFMSSVDRRTLQRRVEELTAQLEAVGVARPRAVK